MIVGNHQQRTCSPHPNWIAVIHVGAVYIIRVANFLVRILHSGYPLNPCSNVLVTYEHSCLHSCHLIVASVFCLVIFVVPAFVIIAVVVVALLLLSLFFPLLL